MTENEKQRTAFTKQKIRDRYRDVNTSELTIIPAKPPKSMLNGGVTRVAAYIRVSTDTEEQKLFYELQKNYFTECVKAHPGWVLVDIYSDERISGTQINNSDGLQRLLADCKAGKIDYILINFIPRFARNSMNHLNITDDQKKLNPPVEVIFETNYIDSLSNDDTQLLSILASMADAESRNKSKVMNWYNIYPDELDGYTYQGFKCYYHD